jgi:hypothetical protein
MTHKPLKYGYSLILFIILTFSYSCDLFKPNHVADPIFTPPGGHYTQNQQVTLSCATEGAEIRYSLDGSIPPTNSIVYTGPFEVPLLTTVKAMAIKQESVVVM